MSFDTSIIKSFSVSGNEPTIEILLAQLKFISKIKELDKVSVNEMRLIDKESYYESFNRKLSGESRDDSFIFIKEVMTKSIDLAYYYLDKKEAFYGSISTMLFDGLKEARTGLLNLSKTYESDTYFVSKIEILYNTISVKLALKDSNLV